MKVFLIHSVNFIMINAQTCLDLPSSNKRSHRLCPWFCLPSWLHLYTGQLAGGMLALRQGAQYLCGCSETHFQTVGFWQQTGTDKKTQITLNKPTMITREA